MSGLIGASPSPNAETNTVPPGEGPDTFDLSPRFRPWSEPAQGSGVPLRCHFLRTVTPDGRLVDAQTTAIPSHRCAAFGDPLPLSLRQQELVCLQRVHVSCPRYVRGTLLASEAEAQPQGGEDTRRFPLLTVVAIALVALSVLILIAGGLGMFGGGAKPAPPASPSTVANASASIAATPTPAPTATAALSATPTVAATPTRTPTASPTPAATASPTATPKSTPTPAPTAAATPTPASSPTWPPGATASRMNLVTPCTDQANCYLYTVRSAAQNGSPANDTLQGIANFFGVKLSAILQMNPWASGGVTPGQQLKIPPPTR